MHSILCSVIIATLQMIQVYVYVALVDSAQMENKQQWSNSIQYLQKACFSFYLLSVNSPVVTSCIMQQPLWSTLIACSTFHLKTFSLYLLKYFAVWSAIDDGDQVKADVFVFAAPVSIYTSS